MVLFIEGTVDYYCFALLLTPYKAGNKVFQSLSGNLVIVHNKATWYHSSAKLLSVCFFIFHSSFFDIHTQHFPGTVAKFQ